MIDNENKFFLELSRVLKIDYERLSGDGKSFLDPNDFILYKNVIIDKKYSIKIDVERFLEILDDNDAYAQVLKKCFYEKTCPDLTPHLT